MKKVLILIAIATLTFATPAIAGDGELTGPSNETEITKPIGGSGESTNTRGLPGTGGEGGPGGGGKPKTNTNNNNVERADHMSWLDQIMAAFADIFKWFRW